MQPYDPKSIEPKWQKKWEEEKLYRTDTVSSKETFYGLVEFPYPSGAGLHVGHVRSYTAMDIIARQQRMLGKEVLFPIGWDAFGLPAENYAIKTGIHPSITTQENIANFRRQLKACGFSFDWDREVDTTDPAYYKWTQWIFLKLYEKDLAYKRMMPVNWCPKDKCVLANEEVIDGACERCGTPVEKRDKEQWMLAITKYAERLHKDLDDTTYLEKIKIQQRNWIGLSEGSEIQFTLKSETFESAFGIFTTRADTIFGATYCVLAPEHPLVGELLNKGLLKNAKEVEQYRKDTSAKIDIDRSAEGREKTGVKLEGVMAINPASKEDIPVFIADYVLPQYGTGAIMAVPAHDERDYAFAKQYGLPIKPVINPSYIRDDVKEGTSVEQKKKIVAIVENSKGEILCINWGPTMGGKLFLGGTIEEGEDPGVTALRELKEETGYTEGKVIEVSDETFNYIYYAFSKNKFYQAATKFVHIKLENENRTSQQLEENEKNKFEVLWLTKNQAETEVKEVLHHRAFDLFINQAPYAGTGTLYNSDGYDGYTSADAKKKITEDLGGKVVVKSKLRDWVFARQRYWGEPVPIVYDKEGKMYPVHESELPVVLPQVERYEPTDNGESPLSQIQNWVNVKGAIEDGCFKSVKNFTSRSEKFTGSGKAALKEGEEIQHRKVIDVIIKDGNENYYVLKDELFGHKLVGGGIEEGEDEIQAVEREVKEETGFCNIAVTKKSELVVDYAGYHERKKKNIRTVGHCFEVTLRDDERISSEDGQGEHSVVKVKKEELEEKLSWEHHKLFAKEYINGRFSPIEDFRRETDTMPQWAGSCWYFMRYIDSRNDTSIGDQELFKKWLPVDWYNGGMEHTTLHLLYSRFWYKFLFDIGVVPTSEPYYRRTSQGMILGVGGVKMSKSLGNVVNPDDIIKEYGADTLRMYEMFVGPFDQAVAWEPKAIIGVERFLERVWSMKNKISLEVESLPAIHQAIKKVTEGIPSMAFNTSVSAMMICLNEFEKTKVVSKEDYENFLRMLAPFAPHIAEEIWSSLGRTTSIHKETWPAYGEAKLVEKEVTIVVQINGKMRGSFVTEPGKSDALLQELAEKTEGYQKYVGTAEPKKIIIVKDKLINIVI